MDSAVAQGIYTVSGYLTAEECAAFIAETEAAGYEPATINAVGGAVRDPRIRDNHRHVRDDRALAARLWPRTRDHIPAFLTGCQAIGLNERFRFYRYDPGERFSLHTDAPFRRENGEHSLLTLIAYLNDGFTGGETAFAEHVVPARQGTVLIFRHELPHEGRSVTAGRKYALRSDVMFNPPGRISG